MKTEADILLRSGRRWLISADSIAADPRVLAAYVLVCPFAMDINAAEAIVGTVRSTGCHLIVCVGTGAEKLHDQIDRVLEANDQDGVVTTWHDGPRALEDAIEFVEFTGIAPVGVVRVHSNDPSIVERTLNKMSLAAMPID